MSPQPPSVLHSDRQQQTFDREAILRVLEDCPEEPAELRATLRQEHVWRQRERL